MQPSNNNQGTNMFRPPPPPGPPRGFPPAPPGFQGGPPGPPGSNFHGSTHGMFRPPSSISGPPPPGPPNSMGIPSPHSSMGGPPPPVSMSGPPPPGSMGGPPGSLSGMPPPPGSLSGMSPPPGSLSGMPPPPGSLSGMPPPPGSLSGMPPPPGSLSGMPPPPGSLSGMPPPPGSLSGMPPPPGSLSGMPPPPGSLGGMPPPPGSLSGMPPPPGSLGGMPPPPGGPPHQPVAPPPVPPGALGRPPMPPISMGGSHDSMSGSRSPLPPRSMERPPSLMGTPVGLPPMSLPPPPGSIPPSLMSSSPAILSSISGTTSTTLSDSWDSSGGSSRTQISQPLGWERSNLPPVQADTVEVDDRGGPVPLMSIDVKPPTTGSNEDDEMEVAKPQRPTQVVPAPVTGMIIKSSGTSNFSEKSGPLKSLDKLPHALEKVLAFKDIREREVEAIESSKQKSAEEKVTSRTIVSALAGPLVPEEEEDKYEDERAARRRQDMNRKKRDKKKRSKARKVSERENKEQISEWPRNGSSNGHDSLDDTEGVEIEYVQEMPEELTDPTFRQFRKIFEYFKISDAEKGREEGAEEASVTPQEPPNIKDLPMKARAAMLVEDDLIESKDVDANKMSKKKLKKLTRLSVSELKQLVARPDVVEMHDVCARDPKLLILLKSCRNAVPVPRHWCAKRKYLQGKRGLEKQPFELPSFIRDTGIMDMRQAVQDKEADKTLKTKMRERVRPKVGKVDIDYHKLHDAFFKYQTKPKLSIHGDLYYEGKEFEVKLKEKKPGILSDSLRTALGMPLGMNCDRFPPPWLIAMQRYGPPPSYPNLKIPGLNAPIPDGCSFGYHAGGWGKPPVDENGKPLYGNVFGHSNMAVVDESLPDEVAPTETSHWGELESDEESESEEESSDEEGDEDEERAPGDASGLNTPAEGLITPSGTSSVGAGLETPESIELRKKTIEEAMESGGATPQLFHILPEMEASVGDAFMGSSKLYDLGSGANAGGASSVAGLSSVGGDVSEGGTASQQQRQKRKRPAGGMQSSGSAQGTTEGATQDKTAKKYKEFKF